jgi:hypothetical protein
MKKGMAVVLILGMVLSVYYYLKISEIPAPVKISGDTYRILGSQGEEITVKTVKTNRGIIAVAWGYNDGGIRILEPDGTLQVEQPPTDYAVYGGPVHHMVPK